MKRVFLISFLLSAIFVASPCLAGEETMGQIAVFTASVGWTDLVTASAQAQIILNNLELTNEIEILGDDEIGQFAEQNTDDGDLDIIITFGYFPVSLYPPGNAQANDSVGELFLEGGDMFMNTCDYVFYVSSVNNGDAGLKNMTDSTFDLWVESSSAPTEEGKKYTPAFGGASAPRGFQKAQVEANSEWELEIAFGITPSNTVDPAVIRNVEYGGRVAIWYQVSDNSKPRGNVAVEILDNWLSEVVESQAVAPAQKLTATWGKIKSDS